MTPAPARWADEEFCYVTTTGRRTGRPHEIEIWFGWSAGSIYLLGGGRESADWVRNLRVEPRVFVRVAGEQRPALARIVEDAEEERAARESLASKYQGWSAGKPMSEWARTALVVAVDPE